ncbi:MAG: DUF5681 domain-containing protein [Prevotella sp.]|jgi:hypothetical protein|nr:DUF5681 domain-containing protein [Prevotella sp.]
MSGVKGKSGLKKGQTNNPNGRPQGSKNILAKELRDTMHDRVKQDKVIEKAFDCLATLTDPKEYLNECRWLFRYILPFAVSDEELDAIAQSQSPLVSRLFRKDDKD